MVRTDYKGKVMYRGDKKYVWCSYFEAYFPARMFYRNAAQPSGYQSECKVVSKARTYGKSISQIVATLNKNDKKLFVN